MKRGALNVLTDILVLLCIIVAGLWTSSYLFASTIIHTSDLAPTHTDTFFESVKGRIRFYQIRQSDPQDKSTNRKYLSDCRFTAESFTQFKDYFEEYFPRSGFDTDLPTSTTGIDDRHFFGVTLLHAWDTSRAVVLPYWLVLLLAAPLPIWRTTSRWRARSLPNRRVGLKHRLLMWIQITSLLLSLLMIVLWIASRRQQTSATYYLTTKSTDVPMYLVSREGIISLGASWETPPPSEFASGYGPLEIDLWSREGLGPGSALARSPNFEFLDFSYTLDTSYKPTGGTFEITFPHWSFVILFAAIPIISALAWLKRRSRTWRGRCQACGYDLRATPDAAGPRLSRCPECGRSNGEEDAPKSRSDVVVTAR